MRVGFVQRDVFDTIGLMQLAAVLEPRGHDVCLALAFSDEAILRKLEAMRPDALALTVTAGVSKSDGFRLAAEYKRRHPENPIVIGGSYVTLYPEVFGESAADYLCVGEGESAFPELLESLAAGGIGEGIQNIWRKNGSGDIDKTQLRPLVEDLDSLPLPERKQHYAHPVLRNQRRKNFIASRGCPFQCSYCYIATARDIYNGLGKFVRWRSPGNVVEEIERVKRDYGFEYVGFMDDLFPYEKEWLAEFAKLYREKVRAPFIASSRTELLDDESIRLFAEAGCDTLGIGIECAKESLREGILERRSESNTEIVSKLKAARAAGIRVLTFNMMGIPGETAADAWKTIEMNAEAGIELPRFTMLTPSPGLKVTEAATRGGYCSAEEVKRTGPYLRRSVFHGDEIRRIERIQKVAFAASKYPALGWLWKLLAAHAPGFALDAIYLATNGWMFLRINKWSAWTALRYGRTVARWYE